MYYFQFSVRLKVCALPMGEKVKVVVRQSGYGSEAKGDDRSIIVIYIVSPHYQGD